MECYTLPRFIVIIFYITSSCCGQFPAVCVKNATKEPSICCPTFRGDQFPCGWPERGWCIDLQVNDDLSRVNSVTSDDDRYNWPTFFFEYACECFGNYGGYACHECQFGFNGPRCQNRITRIRKNLKYTTKEERRYIVETMDKARHVTSDYMVLNTSHSSDPATDPHFVSVSVFDYLAYLHYYGSRNTIVSQAWLCEERSPIYADFAHRGSAFPLWHRYYMLVWEKEMQKVSDDEYFTFPYWNWIDQGNSCEVCTNEFMGEEAITGDLRGGISRGSVLSDWYVLCIQDKVACPICDPAHRTPVIRRPGQNRYAPILPTSEEVAYLMSLNTYDFPDFDIKIPDTGFRGVFEGYSTKGGLKDNMKMHNAVHGFMKGTFSSSLSSSFDPVFYLHHSFLDKIFEIWLRRTNAHVTQLPSVGARPGHNRNSPLVPFFPLVRVSWGFRSLRHFGVDYDDMTIDYGNESHASEQNMHTGEPSETATQRQEIPTDHIGVTGRTTMFDNADMPFMYHLVLAPPITVTSPSSTEADSETYLTGTMGAVETTIPKNQISEGDDSIETAGSSNLLRIAILEAGVIAILCVIMAYAYGQKCFDLISTQKTGYSILNRKRKKGKDLGIDHNDDSTSDGEF